MVDLEASAVVAGNAVEPLLPRCGIDDPVRIAELVGSASLSIGHRGPPQQCHRHLRAEAGGEPQRVPHWVLSTLRQCEVAEFGVGFAKVRNRRHDAGLERLDRDHVLDSGAHCVACETLGVGDHDPVGAVAEHLAERVDLSGRRTASCGCVGLVRDEHRLAGDLRTIDPPRLGLSDHGVHHRSDVFDVETSPVERRVRGDRTEHLADRVDPPLAGGVGRFDDERCGTHPHDHPVATTVERGGGVFDVLVGRSGAACQETAGDPRHQCVARCVVRRHHDHAAASTGTDPILGHGDRLGGRSACRVDLGVRAAGADDLGELRVPHRQHPEEESAVELVRMRLDLAAKSGDQLIDFGEGARVAVESGAQSLEGQQMLATGPVGCIALDVLGESVVAGKGTGEDDAGVVAHLVGQPPAVR